MTDCPVCGKPLSREGHSFASRRACGDVAPDLSPKALARIAPGLSLAAVGRLAEPPISREQMCVIRAGRPMLPETQARVEAALQRARELAARGELVLPKSSGRPRKGDRSCS